MGRNAHDDGGMIRDENVANSLILPEVDRAQIADCRLQGLLDEIGRYWTIGVQHADQSGYPLDPARGMRV